MIGSATVLRIWRTDVAFREAALEAAGLVRAHLPMLLVSAATLAAGCILAIVAMHVITD